MKKFSPSPRAWIGFLSVLNDSNVTPILLNLVLLSLSVSGRLGLADEGQKVSLLLYNVSYEYVAFNYATKIGTLFYPENK